jgi:cell division cycle 20-like protein 1 (cofactor of APC complex)
MGDYKRKLRSAKNSTAAASIETTEGETEEAKNVKQEQIYEDDSLYKEDPESPRTPPTQASIESYFPPSPFGRKRHQPHGDRFIPSRDRNLARDFQMMESSPSNSSKRSNDVSATDTPTNNRESRRISAFFRAELLEDLSAVDEYVFPDAPARTPRRVLHYTNPASSSSSSINNTSSIVATATHHVLTSIPASTSFTHHTSSSTSNANNNSHSRYSPEPIHREASAPPILSPSPTLASYNLDYTTVLDLPGASRFQISPIGEAGRRILLSSDRSTRQINTTAIKILDAPELQDDFYLNLVDWGSNDCLAVGLGSCVYLWNANTSRVTKLCDFVTEAVTSVNWSHAGSLLAVGTNNGRSLLYDTETSKRIRSWSSHTSRIGKIDGPFLQNNLTDVVL